MYNMEHKKHTGTAGWIIQPTCDWAEDVGSVGVGDRRRAAGQSKWASTEKGVGNAPGQARSHVAWSEASTDGEDSR
jgi:hypothetical protein